MAVALPLESNPDVMNKYLQKLGVSDKWKMVDVLGLEDDALEWVPQPVLAVLLLFPLSENYEEYRVNEENEVKSKGQNVPNDVFHLKQVLSNICGTVALVHSVANNVQQIDIDEGPLKKYLNDAEGLDAAAKGALLENSTAFLDVYKDLTGSVDGDAGETNNHFVTFVHKNGMLVELDGRKSFPIIHGKTTSKNFLKDAAKICRSFIDREPDNIGFNVVALVPAE
ncbi:ubiquitin carboxyl-terminal hydrolase-like [Leptidea sinapis]|nr:ubiquitin carboxyl-terminal hydrolase-like [Leptidea sinapis]